MCVGKFLTNLVSPLPRTTWAPTPSSRNGWISCDPKRLSTSSVTKSSSQLHRTRKILPRSADGDVWAQYNNNNFSVWARSDCLPLEQSEDVFRTSGQTVTMVTKSSKAAFWEPYRVRMTSKQTVRAQPRFPLSWHKAVKTRLETKEMSIRNKRRRNLKT